MAAEYKGAANAAYVILVERVTVYVHLMGWGVINFFRRLFGLPEDKARMAGGETYASCDSKGRGSGAGHANSTFGSGCGYGAPSGHDTMKKIDWIEYRL